MDNEEEKELEVIEQENTDTESIVEETGNEPVIEENTNEVVEENEIELNSNIETGSEPVNSISNSNDKKSKKIILILIIAIVIMAIVLVFLLSKDKKDTKNNKSNSNNTSNEEKKEKKLPLPELSGGERGKLGIDKNVNEKTIDEYLGREDAVYRDMRMLEDPANYEAIGGDRFLSGYIKGFEVVPLPYILPVSGLPEAVGKSYEGKTLFSVDKNGAYVANYEESRKIIEELFPKDKTIFLMCGGGGYAGMMRAFLISLGWDQNKIYNIGGHWYYEGKNNIEVKKVVDGKTVYDFDNVPYHKIEFDKLTEIKKEDEKPKDTAISLTSKYYNNELETEWDKISYEEVDLWYDKELSKIDYDKLCPEQAAKKNDEHYGEVDGELKEGESLLDEPDYSNDEDEEDCKAYTDAMAKLETEYDKRYATITNKKLNILNTILDSKETFIITFDEGHRCGVQAENDPRGYMLDIAYKYNIYTYDIGMDVYKKSRLYQTVKYAPGVIIYSNGKIVAYTDAENNNHTKLYESEKAFKEWLTKYIKLSK